MCIRDRITVVYRVNHIEIGAPTLQVDYWSIEPQSCLLLSDAMQWRPELNISNPSFSQGSAVRRKQNLYLTSSNGNLVLLGCLLEIGYVIQEALTLVYVAINLCSC